MLAIHGPDLVWKKGDGPSSNLCNEMDGGGSTFIASNLDHNSFLVLEIDLGHVQVFDANGVGEYFSFDLAALARAPKEKYSVKQKNRPHLLARYNTGAWARQPNAM